jgi:hypothetical protein
MPTLFCRKTDGEFVPVLAALRCYDCDDYLASEWATRGCWDESCQLMLIVPTTEVEERPELSFLVVGNAGVDGIEIGYRAGLPGLWAYYPIDQEFVSVDQSVNELVERFHSGKLIF